MKRGIFVLKKLLYIDRIYIGNILFVKKKICYVVVVFSWYYGKIFWEEVEVLLNDFCEEGDFLVRDSVYF